MRARIDLSKLFATGSEAFKALNRSLADSCVESKHEHHRQKALDSLLPPKKAVVPISARLFVEFVRIGGEELDHDNLINGLKAVRDFLAIEIFGKAGDAPKDGIEFDYRQVPRQRGKKVPKETLINIYIEE